MRSSSPRIRSLVAFVVVTATLTLSASAFADNTGRAAGYTESKDDAGQVVKFTDDPLGATGLDSNIPLIGSRKPAQRTQLMRARVNFVTEMRRSVESL